jgi:hypothetical protein
LPEPVTLNDPVNCCTFVNEFPKILEPELYTTEELIVLTTKVCAVKVPLISAAEAVIAPKMF